MTRSAARPLRRAALGLSAAAAATAAYGVLVEPNMFAVRRERILVLPPGREPVRILHISDLHQTAWQRRKPRWVRSLAARLQPDFVLNTGDNYGGSTKSIVLDSLDDLLDIPGAFVLGSNDFWAPRIKNPARYLLGPSNVAKAHSNPPDLDARGLIDAFEQRGWTQLDNRSAVITIKGTRIGLSGLGDAHMKADAPEAPAFPDGSEVKIGVTHAPYSRVLDRLGGAGAQLIAAGHTHGGQIRVPFYGAPATNCDRPRDEARGLFRRGGALVNVTAGVGVAPMAPIRLFCRPEVSVLELISR